MVSTIRYSANASSDHHPNQVPGILIIMNPKQPNLPTCSVTSTYLLFHLLSNPSLHLIANTTLGIIMTAIKISPKTLNHSILSTITNSDWTKSLRDGLPRLWHSDFLFSITKQWKASPKSSIVKSPQRNNQTGSTFPLPMKRIPPFRLVGKRFYDQNAPPYKAVFRITTDFIWRILLCMKNI